MRRAAILGALVFPALLVLGCTESAEQNTFIVRVSSIHDGGPLLADVIAFDDQQNAFIPTDVVNVVFTNKAYSPSVVTDPSVFWYDFQLESYSVHWRRTDGGPTSGTGWSLAGFDHTETLTAVVPFNGSITVGALVVPVEMKTQPPFDALVAGGTIPLVADIEFVGSPAIDADDDIRVQASLSVTFANFGDQ